MGQAINTISMRMMGRRLIPMMGVAPFITLGNPVLHGDPSAPAPGGTIFGGLKPSENPLRPAPDCKPAAGRNALCPCGSGKKFKKCYL